MNQKTLQVKSEVLEDYSSSGRKRPWAKFKLANEYLAMAYDSIDKQKAEKLRGCATWLGFTKNAEGRKKLVEANFCRIRLCPMCQWRRALKSYTYTRRIITAMLSDYRERGINLRWLMITLTVKNCEGEELSSTLDRMQESWYRLVRTPEFNHVIGWYRALEVTHDCNPYITDSMYCDRKSYYDNKGLKVGDANPNYNTYHPHYHVLIAVSDKYARISYKRLRERWGISWMGAARLDYLPQVDVRRSYKQGKESTPDEVGAMVAEAAKYTCKPKDYIIPDDWDLTIETVKLLDKALHNRRLVAYGKACKEWNKKLNLEDIDGENADLVGADGQDGTKLEPVIYYAWRTGYSQYIAE